MANINCPDFRYGSSFQVLQQEKQKLKKKNLETAKIVVFLLAEVLKDNKQAGVVPLGIPVGDVGHITFWSFQWICLMIHFSIYLWYSSPSGASDYWNLHPILFPSFISHFLVLNC